MTATLYRREEDDYLRANYLAQSNENLARHLRRPTKSIVSRLRKLGLRRFKMTPFTTEEDLVILAASGRSSTEVAAQLRRAPSVVRLRARRLGIPSWKAFSGGLKEFRGYKVAKIDRGDGTISRRVPEHRDIMEKIIGRPLTSDERVHHINCRKRDNRPENLHLFGTDAEHSRAHHSMNDLVADLLEHDVIRFNALTGTYELSPRMSGRRKAA